MDVDRVTKKKVSEDKVTKHEGKRTKTMRHIKLEDSDDESEKGPIDQEGGVSLLQGNDDKLESHEAKKKRRKEDRLQEAVKQLKVEDLGPSKTASDLQVETEAQRKKKKKAEKRNAKRAQERQMAKQAAAQALAGLSPTDGHDIFMTDVKPTPANLERLEPGSSDDEDEDMEDGGAPLPKKKSGYTAPPSGVNRAVRRRFILIEREKVKIKKSLGVPEGSDEKAEEVKQLLDKFIGKLDKKTAERESNRKDRKKKDVARHRGKRLKLEKKKEERREKSKSSRDN